MPHFGATSSILLLPSIRLDENHYQNLKISPYYKTCSYRSPTPNTKHHLYYFLGFSKYKNKVLQDGISNFLYSRYYYYYVISIYNLSRYQSTIFLKMTIAIAMIALNVHFIKSTSSSSSSSMTIFFI